MSGFPCFVPFADALAKDFGVSEENREEIKLGLEGTIKYYDSIKPKKDLGGIVSEGTSCVSQSAVQVYARMDRLFNDFIIACIIIVFVVSLVLVFLVGTHSYSLAILFGVFGLASLVFATYLFYTRSGTVFEGQSVDHCTETFQKELTEFSEAERTAVLSSMCHFVSS
jgi:hypothetical protein